MYLSNQSVDKLDNLIKNFEVAYRSYVVQEIKNNFSTQAEFSLKLQEINKSLSHSSILNSSKY